MNVNQLNEAYSRARKYASAVAASAIATANLPMPAQPGKTTVGAAMGAVGGQAAFAIGLARISDDARITVKGSLNYNSTNVGAGVGVGYSF